MYSVSNWGLSRGEGRGGGGKIFWCPCFGSKDFGKDFKSFMRRRIGFFGL